MGEGFGPCLQSTTKEPIMSETCETVKVKAPVTDDNPAGYIVINASDVNDSHELFDAEAAPKKAPKKAEKPTE